MRRKKPANNVVQLFPPPIRATRAQKLPEKALRALEEIEVIAIREKLLIGGVVVMESNPNHVIDFATYREEAPQESKERLVMEAGLNPEKFLK